MIFKEQFTMQLKDIGKENYMKKIIIKRQFFKKDKNKNCAINRIFAFLFTTKKMVI